MKGCAKMCSFITQENFTRHMFWRGATSVCCRNICCMCHFKESEGTSHHSYNFRSCISTPPRTSTFSFFPMQDRLRSRPPTWAGSLQIQRISAQIVIKLSQEISSGCSLIRTQFRKAENISVVVSPASSQIEHVLNALDQCHTAIKRKIYQHSTDCYQ